MAFTGNKSDKEVVKSRQLYTGLANFTVLGVNPTKEELEKLGITQKTGEYLSKDDKGNDQVRLDIWLKPHSYPLPASDPKKLDTANLKFGPQKISFYLTNREVQSSKSSKKLWISKAGRTTWAEKPEDVSANPKMGWYDVEGMRPILNGEESLTQFIAALANVDIREDSVECRLDDPVKLTKGTYKELKALFSAWKTNVVQLLVGVNVTDKGNFQDFYKDFFGRPTVKDYSIWSRKLKDVDNGLPAKRYRNFEIQDNLEFQEFSMSHDIGVPKVTGVSEDGGYVAPPAQEGVSDAPPF